MRITHPPQDGVALLAMLAFLLVGSLALQYPASTSLKQLQLQTRSQTQLQLHAAREALIARAVNDDNRPGSLPCPDLVTDNIGLANHPGDGKGDMLTRNQCPNPIGWFPWVTLNVARPQDQQHGTLWLVVAPALRDDDSAYPINSNITTGLSFNGQHEIAAILIAAGPPSQGQQRPSSNPNDYLNGQFTPGSPLEYRLTDNTAQTLILDRASLFAAVEQRVAQSVRRCLAAHHAQTGAFPWPAPLSASTGNGQAGEFFGRIPLTQPTPGSSEEIRQARSRLQSQLQNLENASSRSEQLLAIGTLTHEVRHIHDWLDSLGSVSTELEELAGNSEKALLALIKSIDSAAGDGRISRTDASTIRARFNAAHVAVNPLIDAILRYGQDPDEEAHSGPPRILGKLENGLTRLIEEANYFFMLDSANPRPVQSTLVAPAQAVATAAGTLVSHSITLLEHARRSKLSAQESRVATSILLDTIERKNGALDNLHASLSKPGSSQEIRTTQSLLEVQQASINTDSALLHTENAARGAAATAWPMVWASQHCQFLQRTTGWWQKNTWTDTVFYHFADPALSNAGLLQAAGHDNLPLIVISAGATRPHQVRPSPHIGDYLEGGNARQPVRHYQNFHDRSEGNDQLAF